MMNWNGSEGSNRDLVEEISQRLVARMQGNPGEPRERNAGLMFEQSISQT